MGDFSMPGRTDRWEDEARRREYWLICDAYLKLMSHWTDGNVPFRGSPSPRAQSPLSFGALIFPSSSAPVLKNSSPIEPFRKASPRQIKSKKFK